MTKLNWNPLLQHNFSENCFWKQQQSNGFCGSSDEKDILAGLALQFSLPNVNVVRKPSAKSHINLHFLDRTAAQNILISLRTSMKHLLPEQIKEEILSCETSKLNSMFVDTLIKCIPQQDKMEELRKLNDNGIPMLDVEKFVTSLSDIEHLVPRLEFINFKMCYEDTVKNLESDIMAMMAAFHEIIASDKFGKILVVILSIGNSMNSGSINNKARGFDLAVLSKLHEIKSANNASTLLHYIVQSIQQKFPECLDFADELHHVSKAARLNFAATKKTVEQVSASFERFQKLLKGIDEPCSPKDKFNKVMSSFLSKCVHKVNVVATLMSEMESLHFKASKHFAFNTSKCSVDDFIANINTFVNSFTKTYTVLELKKPKGTAKQQQKIRIIAPKPRKFKLPCKVNLKRLTKKGK